MKTGNLKTDGMTIAIKTPASFKKICKLFFTGRDTSLYVHFYATTSTYYYGASHFSAGVDNRTVNFKNGRRISIAPKLSYHESGQVHFKLGEDRESIEKVRATPLAQLNNKHIITIHVLDLEAFEDCYPKKKTNYCVIQLQEHLANNKITIYGSNKDISARYPVGFVLSVHQIRVFFGLLHSNPAQVFEIRKGFYVLSGWNQQADNVDDEADFLFLMSDQ